MAALVLALIMGSGTEGGLVVTACGQEVGTSRKCCAFIGTTNLAFYCEGEPATMVHSLHWDPDPAR